MNKAELVDLMMADKKSQFDSKASAERALNAVVDGIRAGITKDGKVRPLSVKAGDRTLFGKYTGSEVKLDGEEHLILREDEVLAIIEK